MADTTELFEAIAAGDVDRVRAALAGNPSLASAANEGGVSAVLMALYCQKRDVADAILAAGAPLNIWEAAATGRTDRVRELLAEDRSLVTAYAPDLSLIHI